MEKIEKVQRDRLGIYIGRARVYEGIKQEVLAEGICRIDVLFLPFHIIREQYGFWLKK